MLQGLGYATATWNYPGTGLLDAGLHNSSWLDNLISLYDPDKVVMEFVGNDFNPFDPAITLDSPLYLPTWADAAITDTAKLTARGATVYWMLLPAMPSFVGFPPIDQIYDNLPTGVVDCYTPFGGAPPDMSLRVADGHLAFVYKTAAEIGELGDNTARLRAQIRDDNLLRLALRSETATAPCPTSTWTTA